MIFIIDSPSRRRNDESRELYASDITSSSRIISACQVSITSWREPSKRQWTWQVVALTSDFHLVASSLTTGFTAVFFSVRYIAEARYVRALLALLFCHFGFHPLESAFFFTTILDVAPFTLATNRSFEGSPVVAQLFGDYVILGNCMQISKLVFLLSHSFPRLFVCQFREASWSECRQVDPASVFGRSPATSTSDQQH
jgi:hypothetical protein